MTKALFVCSGNICRSPIAEAVCHDLALRRGKSVEVRSAGTLGIVDRPADPHAVAVCAEIGLDLRGHRSQALSAELLAWADWALVMEFSHAMHIRETFPDHRVEVLMLGHLGGLMEIADPIGGWRWQFRRTREEIIRCVAAFVDGLPD